MRVSVVFRNTPVLVPVGEGRIKISDLIEMAITRYKKTDSRLAEFTITVRSLRLADGGSFVDVDDEVADVLDDREAVVADFDLIGDSMSTSSQESGPILTSAVTSRVQQSQSDVASNMLSVSSTSNPSLADHDDSISSDMSPWTPSTSAAMVTENDIPDLFWRQEHRAASNNVGHSNRSGSFSNSQSERFDSSTGREMAVDGPLRSNRSSFTEALSEGRLRLPLTDSRSRNSYAGPGVYERERRYEEPYPRVVRKPYNLMDANMSGNHSEYMRYRYRNQGYHGGNRPSDSYQHRPAPGMFARHGSTSNIMQQGRVAADDGGAYQSRYEEPGVDYFLSQPQYLHEHRANEPSGYALSQPAHTFRGGRPSVVHAADLDPNSEAPHLRHLSQDDDHSSRSDTPTYRTSPVSEGMRLDAATYHGNKMLRFSDNEDDDNCSATSDHGREDGRQKLSSSRYNPFQRNRRLSIQRDGVVFARWAEYVENSGIPESDEDKDDESVRHVGYSSSSSREELSSYHGNNHRTRTTSPLVSQVSQEYINGRGQASNLVQSPTESETEDDLGNIHIIELHKGSHDLGIKIKKCSVDKKDLGIFVDAMETEGFAAVSQKLQINDRILACNGCDFTKLPNRKAEDMFKEMMDEPLLRMAISRGNQFTLGGEGSDISDHHHGDGDSTVDGSDPGYGVTNTKEIGVIHEIRIVKGSQGLGFGVTTREVNTSGTTSQPIYVKNIAKDGPAFKDGKLRLGDRLLKVNDVLVEKMNQSQVVQLMRSLPQGPILLQVSRQETRPCNDDVISPLEASHESSNELSAVSAGVVSGRTVMTFDITMHHSDTASLGVTVHGRTRLSSPSHASKNADVGIYIKSIVPGGLAALDGRVQQGDQVLCVNGHNLLDKSNSEAMVVLKNALAQIKPGTNVIQLVISRKTTSVPLKSPAMTSSVSAVDESHEVGIDVGNAAIATPNSQSSQSSAGVVRLESSENLLARRRNESEPLSRYSEQRILGSHDYHTGYRGAPVRNRAVAKPAVKRSSSESASRYDTHHHHQSEFTSPTSHNSSSSGSGLVSPTGVTLSLTASYDSNSLSNSYSHRGTRTADLLASSTPVHRDRHVDYPSHSLPRPSKARKKVVSPTPKLESAGSSNDLASDYFRRDAPGRISIKKGKQPPHRDFSQFYFRNSEPKVEGDDTSSIATDLIRTGSAESILANRSPVQYKVTVGPHLGLAKSSSLESLQTILRLNDAATDELVMRETRSSFRKAVDKTYDAQQHGAVSDETDHDEVLLDRSVMSYTKNPQNKVKRRGFLKNFFKKGKNKRLSSLDQHGDITAPSFNQIDFDPTPPARVELRPHIHGNHSNKMYQRYSMSVLDNMEFEDDDITATIADV